MRVVIFEDEPHNAERLIQLLRAYNPDIQILAVIPSVAEGLAWLRKRENADLMLMDIQLSDGNCFEIFLGEAAEIPVIFTTAYDKFALQAFKVNSIDYLMKPVDPKELHHALQKYEKLTGRQPAPVSMATLADAFLRRQQARFTGRINNQLIYVKAQDIAYIRYDRGITRATTHDGQHTPLDYSLEQMEAMLDPLDFFRINRQFIISIDAIKKITSYYNSRLILQLAPEAGTDVIISREKVAAFKNWLEGKK